MTVGEWTSLISAVTAIVAIVTGPLFSYLSTKKKVKADVISRNRSEWIENVRAKTAKMVSDLGDLYRAELMGERTGNFYEATQIQSALYHNTSLLIMHLNPNQKNHENLINILRHIEDQIATDHKKRDSIGYMKGLLTEAAQDVLKDAWEQVKKDVG